MPEPRPSAAPPVQAVLVRSTYAEEGHARAAARALVEGGLAACVHVAQVHSTYRWQGEVVEEAEWLLEARVVGEGAERAAARLQEDHPYAVPLIETVQSIVDREYAGWAWREQASRKPSK